MLNATDRLGGLLPVFIRSLAVRLAILSTVIWIVPALAQTTTGRISGAVTDPSDAAVVNAKVVVTNTDTQAIRTVATDGNGSEVVKDFETPAGIVY